MTTLAQASTFNTEASLNAWMSAALQAFTLPQWLPAMPAVIETVPQKPAVMPCFSLIHLPVGADDLWQGRSAGTSAGRMARGILDVSCWVSRSASDDWLMQLRTMRDMVLNAATDTRVVVIADYAGLPLNTVAPSIPEIAVIGLELAGDDGTWTDTPTATEYKINIHDVGLTPTEADVNPDVERVRVLIDYSFVYRSN